MATLSFGEQKKLEEFLGMKSGYVLDFSDRTFRDFVFDSVGLDINDRSVGGEGSKARRLRHFLSTQPDYIVGKLLKDLAESVTVDTDSIPFGTVRFIVRKNRITCCGSRQLFCSTVRSWITTGQSDYLSIVHDRQLAQ